MLLQQRENKLQTANWQKRSKELDCWGRKQKCKSKNVWGRDVKYPCLEEVTFTRISRADKSLEMYKKMGVFKGKQNHFGRIPSCDHI